MNKQTLEARKGQLQADRDQNSQEIAKLQQQMAQRQALDHTLNGAIQDVDFWLEIEAKEEAERLEMERVAAEQKVAADAANLAKIRNVDGSGTCGEPGCQLCARRF